MKFILPNDLMLQSQTIDLDDTFFTKYSSKVKNENIEVRTTTHCLIILLEGTKIITLENQTIKVGSQNIVFLTQNNYFMSEIITKQGKYKALLIYFNDKFIEDFISKYNINVKKQKSVDFFTMDYSDNKIYSLNVDLLNLYIQTNNKILLKMKLEEIFLNALSNIDFISFLNSIEKTSPNRIQFIIESNLDSIDMIEDMCKLTKLTPNKLREYFLKKFNQNPKKWLNEKRLQKSMVLIKTTDKSITQISQDCGYATVSWFINCFKKKYHYTPKEIRQKQ